jgi:hypothetical protein
MIRVFCLTFFLILAACANETKAPPADILTKEKMIDYLIDLQITEAKINSLGLPPDTVKSFYNTIRDELYKKHNISDSVYYKSLRYYLYDVKDMEDIYSAVVDSLSLRERLQKTK